jgi:hypothetical protein
MNERLKDILGRHEEKRRFPYDDADGRQMGPGKRTIRGKLTIGTGRNLEAVGLSDDEIEHLFENDIKRAAASARRLIRNFDSLSENRQIVVVSHTYMMGEAGRFERLTYRLVVDIIGFFRIRALSVSPVAPWGHENGKGPMSQSRPGMILGYEKSMRRANASC